MLPFYILFDCDYIYQCNCMDAYLVNNLERQDNREGKKNQKHEMEKHKKVLKK